MAAGSRPPARCREQGAGACCCSDAPSSNAPPTVQVVRTALLDAASVASLLTTAEVRGRARGCACRCERALSRDLCTCAAPRLAPSVMCRHGGSPSASSAARCRPQRLSARPSHPPLTRVLQCIIVEAPKEAAPVAPGMGGMGEQFMSALAWLSQCPCSALAVPWHCSRMALATRPAGMQAQQRRCSEARAVHGRRPAVCWVHNQCSCLLRRRLAQQAVAHPPIPAALLPLQAWVTSKRAWPPPSQTHAAAP